jgi:hypothetical protein
MDFRNIQILSHQATHRKEAIQRKLEEQMELGVMGLLEEDHWMMEVNLGLGDMMEATPGEQEEYWLLAITIRAGWEAAAAALTRPHTQQSKDSEQTACRRAINISHFHNSLCKQG